MYLKNWLKLKIQKRILIVAICTLCTLIPLYISVNFIYYKNLYDNFLLTNNKSILLALQTGDLISLKKTLNYLNEDDHVSSFLITDTFNNVLISKNEDKTKNNLYFNLENKFEINKSIINSTDMNFGKIHISWQINYLNLIYGLFFTTFVFVLFYLILYKYLIDISSNLAETVGVLPSLIDSGKPNFLYTEIHELNQVFSKLMTAKENIILNENLNSQLKQKQEIYRLAQKVAHDIRSPVSTLNLISSKIENENIKEIHKSVVNRINDIADDLLITAKIKSISSRLNNSETTIGEFVHLLKNENKFNGFTNQIFITNDSNLNNIILKNINILYPVIKNFINNAIEATEEKTRKIEIIFKSKNNGTSFEILVKDNGKGIPDYILQKLGNEQVTSGKQNSLISGNGIAILNAKQDLEKLGFNLSIESILNFGSCFCIDCG